MIYGLTRFKWYRKWVGGNWEKWYVDYPVCSSVWHHDSEGSLTAWYGRPTPLCRCRPEEIEYYGIKQEIEEMIHDLSV